MASGTVAEAVEATKGRLLSGDPAAEWSGAALDSRKVESGELFFALPGEHTDGHRFVADSLTRGAAAAVVERDVPTASGCLIRVGDSLAALHALTFHVRQRVPERLIAVTGSSGKTTTKDLLAAMLATRFRVAKNPGNLNNLYGFPISLLSIAEDAEWMVAEMGMSTPGELSQLSKLGRPDLVVYTNVRPVHLEFFADLRGVGEAKAELLEGLSEDGTVIANADDPEVVRIVGRHRGPIVWYGVESRVDYRVEELNETPEGGLEFLLCLGDETYRVALPLYGRYNAENFLAAAACAHTIGVDAPGIVSVADEAKPASMRGVVHRLAGDRIVIDDSYNSNPDALSQSLGSARRIGGKRHWAVLGSMLELGNQSAEFHRRLGAEAVALGFSPVLAVGSEARPLAQSVAEAGGDAIWKETSAEAADVARRSIQAGDVVLVKGSRGVALDRVVDRLLKGGD